MAHALGPREKTLSERGGRSGLIVPLDPRMRIVMASVFGVVTVALSSIAALAAALAVSLSLMAVSGLPPRQTLKRMAMMDGFIVFMLVLLLFSIPGDPILTVWSFAASWQGLWQAVEIALTANAVILALMVLVGTMESVTLGHALHRLRCPEALVNLLMFTVRYIEVLREEYLRLRGAMRVRGFRPGTNWHTYRSFGYLVGMMLVRAIERSERILGAMKCRAYASIAGAFSDPAGYRLCRRAVGDLPVVAGVRSVMTLIALHDICFAYPGQPPVLNGASQQLKPGQRLALTGPNGSGKSTLLRITLGLQRPTSGTVTLFGAPRRAEADFQEVRRRVGLVFQDPDDQLFCPTVAEDIDFGPRNLGRTRDEALAIVDRVLGDLDLLHLKDRITHKLSGGEKRLVTLATVLAMAPDVLPLDEPTNALDTKNEARLLDILQSLPQAILLVSHSPAFREALAPDRLEVQDGRLIRT